MKEKGLVIPIALVLFSFAVAKDPCDNAPLSFESIPLNINQAVEWLEPYDETFFPFDKCRDVNNFEVVKIEERVENYNDQVSVFDVAEDILWHHYIDLYNDAKDNYTCLISVVRVTYNLSCTNKLKYKGESYLFSKTREKNTALCSKEECDEFKSHAHDWQEKPLDYLNDAGVYRNEDAPEFVGYGIFNKDSLIEKWSSQKVAYPEWKYMGEPGRKLARPVLFIHGLNDDYETWGVESVIEKGKNGENKGKEPFQKGLVKKYQRGSAPDILARSQNVDVSEEHINHNGIYFFQAPGKFDNGEWIEAKPHWRIGDEKESQSRKLYKRLKEILDDFFDGTQIEWSKTPEATIDIVAHSQGGLVVREMLRGLRQEPEYSIGCDNPANHIGRLVTVDTPHLGAATAAENSTTLQEEFHSLGVLIDDLNASDSGNPISHHLLNASAGLDWSEPLSYLIATGSPVVGPLGFFVVASDYNFEINGPYLGPYKISLGVDAPGPSFSDVDDIEIDPLKEYREMAIDTRKKGNHLVSNGGFITGLNYGDNGESYPKKPNGERLNILPLYSGDTSPMVSYMLNAIKENLKITCPNMKEDEKKNACVALETYIEDRIEKIAKGLFDVQLDLDESLLSLLNRLVEEWLSHSDLIVEEKSQRYEFPDIGIGPGAIPELEYPRSYLFHDALAPWETVTHMRLGKIEGMAASTRQGLDIACALDFYCNDLLAEEANSKLIYLNNGSVDVEGDFDMAPIYLGEGKEGVRLTDGMASLEAIYEPGVGSYVNYTDNNGSLNYDLVLPASIATNPRLQREGSLVTVRFNNPSGKVFSRVYDIPSMSSHASFSIIAEENEYLPDIVAGTGTICDQSSQNPPVSPKNWEKEKNVFAMHRETRGKDENNTSRPRILVANASEKQIQGFKLAYYFTADPARKPEVIVDYPKIPVIVENLGGDQWRFVLDARDSVLKAKSVFPNLDGWQIRIHYGDWFDYNHLDDWSADYNVGIPEMNKKIVIYDSYDNILWGEEPAQFKSMDDGLIASPKGILSWRDSAPWEKNAFKPQVLIKNTGSVALKNYHAKLWFRVPQGRELEIPLDDWYTPVSRPKLRNIGKNVWELDLYFDRFVLYSGESVEEGNVGLHLMDWSAFDKTVCGIALIDAEENTIYGKIPSVEECLSYDAPNLLESQYAWRF